MKLFFRLFIIVILTTHSILAKNIIWDLDGVLITTNRLGVAQDIGLWQFAKYFFWDFKSPSKIQSKVFALLREIKNDSNQDLYDTQKLPDIFQELMTGKRTCSEVIALAQAKIEELYVMDATSNNKYFCSVTEKNLIASTVKAMFTPEIRAKNTQLLSTIVGVLKDCIDAQNEDGSKKNKVFILSNYENEIYDQLCTFACFKELFSLFDESNIFISGKIGFSKPDRASFEHVLQKHNLNSQECIFIDDRIENIQSAESLGITSIHLVTPDNYFLRNKLTQLMVL